MAGVFMAPIGAHKCSLARFGKGGLGFWRSLLGLGLSYLWSISIANLADVRAARAAVDARLTLYKKVRKQNFPSSDGFSKR